MHRLRRQTVRPRAAIRVPLLTFPLVFAVTALIVAYWGRDRWIPVNEQTTYTTTVRAVETASSAATPFTVTDSDPQRAKASADALADALPPSALPSGGATRPTNLSGPTILPKRPGRSAARMPTCFRPSNVNALKSRLYPPRASSRRLSRR